MKSCELRKVRRGLSLVLALVLMLGSLSLLAPNAEAAAPLPFADVPENAWYREAVQLLYRRGIFHGVSSTEFDPEGTVTRAMAVTLLHRAEDCPDGGETEFLDVAPEAYYARAAAWAAKEDIVKGVGGGCFAPESPATRQDLAVMLYRFARFRGLDLTAGEAVLEPFSDAGEISGYARAALAWAVENSLIWGVGNGKLCPQAPASRAQAAAILYRLIK